jgi:lipopolysaccharide biosynthesis glycosyltransferase
MFSEAPELFYRLNIKRNYFNAGVMIINYKKWKVENVSEGLRNKVNEIYDKINYWDQDVLNSYVDGKFEELPMELNYIVDSNAKETSIPSNISIVHYAGKSKPWDRKGNPLMHKKLITKS